MTGSWQGRSLLVDEVHSLHCVDAMAVTVSLCWKGAAARWGLAAAGWVEAQLLPPLSCIGDTAQPATMLVKATA